MKKIFLSLICISLISTGAFASLQNNTSNAKSKDVQELNINYNKYEYIKKGRYTYKLDNNGNLIGYYESSLNGKKITEYDMDGNIIKSYRIKPGGKAEIYNSNGVKIN